MKKLVVLIAFTVMLVPQWVQAVQINTFLSQDGDYSGPSAFTFDDNDNVVIAWGEKRRADRSGVKAIGVYDRNKNRVGFRDLEGIGSGREVLVDITRSPNGYYWTASFYKIYTMKTLASEPVVISDSRVYPSSIQYADDGNVYGVFAWEDFGFGIPGLFRIDRDDNVTTPNTWSFLEGSPCTMQLAVDSESHIYFTDCLNGAILKQSPDGTVTGFVDQTDGISNVGGLRCDSRDNVYISSYASSFTCQNSRIIGFDKDGNQIFLADHTDGVCIPLSLKFDRFGNLFFIDSGGVKYIEAQELPVFPPTAGFRGSPRSGQLPMAVAFTDQSVGSISSWSWDFGDGGGSTDQSPTHTYSVPGSYSVSLMVNGPNGSDTETKTDYIAVSQDAPLFDIQANGSDGPITINPQTNLKVTVSLDPKGLTGVVFDWWVCALTPFGTYWYAPSEQWVQSDRPIRVSREGLYDLSEYVLFDDTLYVGVYTFFVALDDEPNGAFDMTLSDSVTVTCRIGDN